VTEPIPDGLGSNGRSGDWKRVLYALSIVASVAAAAWIVDDRGSAKVSREADDLNRRLERLDFRLNQRMDEIALSVRELNQRLDRLLELELAKVDRR
jgi:outer membrane murein-binding lipoprotein Lpp